MKRINHILLIAILASLITTVLVVLPGKGSSDPEQKKPEQVWILGKILKGIILN
jgi:hypothetical protein